MRVRCQQLETVWRVTLTASPGRDAVALDGPGLTQLDGVITAAQSADDCRVLVLESATPGSFCAGMDLRGLIDGGDEPGAAMASYASCLRRLRAMRHAIIAGYESARAGRIPVKRYASASSPMEGVISALPEEAIPGE